jgi:hypothetical protein
MSARQGNALCWSVLQDLSYLLKDNYEQLMQSWLAAAVRLDAKTVSQLDTYCAVSQPLDPDTRDLLITYTDNDHYSQLAHKLGPMMWDISFGVSWSWVQGSVPKLLQKGLLTCVMQYGTTVRGCLQCQCRGMVGEGRADSAVLMWDVSFAMRGVCACAVLTPWHMQKG